MKHDIRMGDNQTPKGFHDPTNVSIKLLSGNFDPLGVLGKMPHPSWEEIGPNYNKAWEPLQNILQLTSYPDTQRDGSPPSDVIFTQGGDSQSQKAGTNCPQSIPHWPAQ